MFEIYFNFIMIISVKENIVRRLAHMKLMMAVKFPIRIRSANYTVTVLGTTVKVSHCKRRHMFSSRTKRVDCVCVCMSIITLSQDGQYESARTV